MKLLFHLTKGDINNDIAFIVAFCFISPYLFYLVVSLA